MQSEQAAKRKSGRPVSGGSTNESTERSRRWRDRDEIEMHAAEAYSVGVSRHVKAMLPKSVPDDLIEQVAEAAAETARIISSRSGEIVAKLCDLAANGDLQAAAILSKSIIGQVSTKVRLPKHQGIDQLCSTVLDEVSGGRMSLEAGQQVMNLAARASDVALAGSLVARLDALKTQLASAQDARTIPMAVALAPARLVALEAL